MKKLGERCLILLAFVSIIGCSDSTGIGPLDDLLGVNAENSMQQEILAALAVARSQKPGTGSI